MNEDTPTVEASEAAINEKLDEIRASNIQRLRSLEHEGYGMNPVLQLKLRLDALTAWVVADEDADRFEGLYEVLFAGELDGVEAEVASHKLTLPQ